MKKKLTGKTCRVVLMLALLPLAAWVVSDYFPTRTAANQDQYVGSEACKDCHEDQFKNFVPTSHARLSGLASWKNKVTGCEACHGPGKAPHGSANPRMLKFSAVNHLCLTCHSVEHGVGADEPADYHIKIHGSRTSPVFFR